MNRILFIDVETTGLSPQKGDKVVEIALIEMIGRELTGNNFHKYINPGIVIPERVIQIHGITNERIKNEPIFSEIEDELTTFIAGSSSLNMLPEFVAHNAQFDHGFLINELNDINKLLIGQYGKFFCTKKMAQRTDKVGPFEKGYRLDDLKAKYNIDIPRKQHGALLDATILAHVYLEMTKDFYV